MENLEKFVEDLKIRKYQEAKIEGDKLVCDYTTNLGNTHIEIDSSIFDFEQELEHNLNIYSRIQVASNIWLGIAYHWKNDHSQPTSDVKVIVHAVNDVIETFTMSDIHVTVNLSLLEKGTHVEKYHFERNGKTLEITRDEISASEAHDRLQYVFEQLKQL